MKPTATITLEKGGEKNFWARIPEIVPGYSIYGCGSTAKKAIEDVHEAEEMIREDLMKEGKEYPEFEYSIKFDIGSFFDYYDYLNVSAVARRLKITPSLMHQYIAGIRRPKMGRMQEIERGLQEIGIELSKTSLGV